MVLSKRRRLNSDGGMQAIKSFLFLEFAQLLPSSSTPLAHAWRDAATRIFGAGWFFGAALAFGAGLVFGAALAFGAGWFLGVVLRFFVFFSVEASGLLPSRREEPTLQQLRRQCFWRKPGSPGIPLRAARLARLPPQFCRRK